ncbi:hypothetical protein JD844_020370 [Phrynosoma platyrhinos]|uniref:Uncharacterized protein n=1 Tax=Phrynosoma platyrhinos TaxID=52577 RepID=A0ABQ7SSF7_PHRPL|nr:hypothetical protein JD844_020370 [Phrynosoma platyrhinos]
MNSVATWRLPRAVVDRGLAGGSPLAGLILPTATAAEVESGAEGLYVVVERCLLCSNTLRHLTCAKCVRRGDLVFFDGRDSEWWVTQRERAVSGFPW